MILKYFSKLQKYLHFLNFELFQRSRLCRTFRFCMMLSPVFLYFGLKNAQGSGESLSISSPDEANMAIATVDEALLRVSRQQSIIGANQNRMEVAKKGIDIASENMAAANSRIEDADLAEKLVEFSKNQVLSQSSLAMIAQANSQSQSVLVLLK